ncbi:sialate O-acetylesterase [Vibrio cyclitrophicus]
MKKIILSSMAFFFHGAHAGQDKPFPYSEIKAMTSFFKSALDPQPEIGSFGRVISMPDSVHVECPTQNEKLGVIVAFGQSNSANQAEYKYTSQELEGVVNFYDGRCYQAKSPLLGATGLRGEWISKTAKNLIDNDVYNKVVVMSSGIGGTPIIRWARDNDLNQMFLNELQKISEKYVVTDMIWHQGETDKKYTPTEAYENMFLSMKETITEAGVNAPIFISIASVCGSSFSYPNKVTMAQENLVKKNNIYLGVNTDKLISPDMRFDGCHFDKAGQEIAARVMAESIKNTK